MSVVFTVLRLPEHENVEEAKAALQDVAVNVQDCVTRYEGHLHQMRADEGGITTIIVFGLPPLAHEDDAARAVGAALALHRKWGELRVSTATGIATGRVFATIVGQCNLFTLVGSVMNLAARLMQLNAGVVCDEATVLAGRNRRRVLAHKLTPQRVKGMPDAIAAYTPYEVGVAEPSARIEAVAGPVGRAAETAVLEEALRDTGRARGSTLLIEGEAGIGKTTLVAELLSAAETAGARTLVGFADSMERVSPYYAWRAIFRQLFDIEFDDGDGEALRRVIVALGSEGGLAPLLSDVLGLDSPDSHETLKFVGEARAATTRRLLLERLRAAAEQSPLVVVVEDAHWLDTSSAALAVEIAEAEIPMLFVVTARRMPEALGDYHTRLLAAPRSRQIGLAGLTHDQTAELIATVMKADRTANEATEFVLSRTGGNPLFIGEIASALRDLRLVTVADGEVIFDDNTVRSLDELDKMLHTAGVSSTVEGIVISRFDKLPAPDKEVLQAMAVAGQPVTARDVNSFVDIPVAEIEQVQQRLVGEFLERPSAGDGYRFRHATLAEVVYGTLAHGERRRLHGGFASVLERRIATVSPGSLDAPLGHHFTQAGKPMRAVPYYFRAAKEAFRNYANVEVIVLCEQVLENLARTDADQEVADNAVMPTRAEVEMLLGRAYLALSQYSQSRASSEAGLAAFGLGIPQAQFRLSSRLLGQMLRQARYRLIRPAKELRDPDVVVDTRKAALALEGLAEIYFYQNESLRSLYAAIHMLNIAELLGPSPELARACAALSGIAGLVGLRRISTSYRQRSLEILDQTNDPAAMAWSFNLLGISRMGTGSWDEALSLFRRTEEIADQIGERRRFRDAVENIAIIAACRGEWATALDYFARMKQSAAEDRDQRYLLLAYRGEAYVMAQLGRFDEVERRLPFIRTELARGLKAEEAPTKQDLYGFAATVAIERGDLVEAEEQATQALSSAEGLTGAGSFPNRYWTLFLTARAFLMLMDRDASSGRDHKAHRRAVEATYKYIKEIARAHPIATPAANLIRGELERLIRRQRQATTHFKQAKKIALELNMPYELDLATASLSLLHPTAANDDRAAGLPLQQAKT